MDFTREPIIETIITPKDGYKLVVRSSKSAGQEEYFVDAVEVVAFGHAFFFRSAERPKAFLVPVSDYEVLEVREARMVLKNIGPDRSIKIGGGRETPAKIAREPQKQEAHVPEEVEQVADAEQTATTTEVAAETRIDPRLDKKRDRRRHSRKRRGREDETTKDEEGTASSTLNIPPLEDDKIVIPAPLEGAEIHEGTSTLSPSILSSLLQPPPTLISETINRYRENALFKSAFFMTEEEQYKPHDKVQDLLSEDDEADFVQPLQEPTFAEEDEGGEVEHENVQNDQEDDGLEIEVQMDAEEPLRYLEESDEMFSEEGVTIPEKNEDLAPEPSQSNQEHDKQ